MGSNSKTTEFLSFLSLWAYELLSYGLNNNNNNNSHEHGVNVM